MKYGKLAALLLLTAAAVPAYAQQSGGDCTITHYDSATNSFTVRNAAPGELNQQCFIWVVERDHPDGAAGIQPGKALFEGNYRISLSGGGGGGGGGGGIGDGRRGGDAPKSEVTQYLAPGVYRLTIGTGGRGGVGCVAEDHPGQHGQSGNPTSLSNAHTNQLIAGYPQAEYTMAARQDFAPAQVVIDDRGRTSASVGAGVPSSASGAVGKSSEPVVQPRAGQDCAGGMAGSNGFISINPA